MSLVLLSGNDLRRARLIPADQPVRLAAVALDRGGCSILADEAACEARAAFRQFGGTLGKFLRVGDDAHVAPHVLVRPAALFLT